MKNKFSIAMSLAVILAMLLTSFVLADTISGDVVGGGATISLGNINAGTSASDTISASMTVTCSGQKHAAVGAMDFTVTTTLNPGSAGSLSEISVTPSLTVPSNWPADSSGCPDISPEQGNQVPTKAGSLSIQVNVPVGASGGDRSITVKVASNDGDVSGNANFTVAYTVPTAQSDITPPVVTVPANITKEASGSSGAVVAFSASATDNVDGSVAVACSPASGSTFALGTTTVTCSAMDAAGNTGSASFSVTVVDTTAPIITVSAMKADASSYTADTWSNQTVTVHYSCTDAASGVASVTGDQTFSLDGVTSLTSGTCTDKAGNSASADFGPIKIDKTAPTATATASPDANANDWNNSTVTVSFSGNDGTGSGIDFCDAAVVLSADGAGQSASGTCTDKAGNVSDPAIASGINIDKVAPTASATALPAANANGWNNTDVTVSFSGTDGLSGIASCDNPITVSTEGADQSASGTCTDNAGNVSAAATATVSLDKTAPSVALVGGPANGSSYYFGFLPAAPTCSASDGLSGLDGSCTVSAYDTSVGTHTVTASATDKAGNSSSASTTYTVLGWSNNGFYQPVDMGKLNIAKNGSTVPLKFEVFAGTTELTDVSFIKKTFVQTLTCGTSVATDDIEQYTSGGTSLRYDTTGGQFVFNWQTPKSPNACFRVTLTLQDGSTISADFKLK